MKDETQPRSIIGRFEIAQICGVSRQGVASVIEHPDFPPPICKQGKTKAPLFYRVEVESFEARRAEVALAAQAETASAAA